MDSLSPQDDYSRPEKSNSLTAPTILIVGSIICFALLCTLLYNIYQWNEGSYIAAADRFKPDTDWISQGQQIDPRFGFHIDDSAGLNRSWIVPKNADEIDLGSYAKAAGYTVPDLQVCYEPTRCWLTATYNGLGIILDSSDSGDNQSTVSLTLGDVQDFSARDHEQ